MCRLLAITNRKLCNNDFLEQISRIAKEDSPIGVVLREKDLSPLEYEALAKDVIRICNENEVECILHSFIDVALKLNRDSIHLPLYLLKENPWVKDKFLKIGVSIHSKEEALLAENLGATYITAGHIFETDCKKGLKGRGLDFLQEICNEINIPVFAIGGINDENQLLAIKAGAYGVCKMSSLIKK